VAAPTRAAGRRFVHAARAAGALTRLQSQWLRIPPDAHSAAPRWVPARGAVPTAPNCFTYAPYEPERHVANESEQRKPSWEVSATFEERDGKRKPNNADVEPKWIDNGCRRYREGDSDSESCSPAARSSSLPMVVPVPKERVASRHESHEPNEMKHHQQHDQTVSCNPGLRTDPPNVPVFSGECQRERGARPAASSAATPCWPAVVNGVNSLMPTQSTVREQ